MVFSVVSAVLAVSNTSQAVTILSGPSFTKATNASLAGTLQLTYVTYRSHRVPDLYGFPAVAVADLNLEYNAGVPHLQFSGDPFRTYISRFRPTCSIGRISARSRRVREETTISMTPSREMPPAGITAS
jgi:hypothetical protein